MWWFKWKSVFQKRRFWWVCTFAQARLSLRNSIRFPCSCSIGGVCAIYASSELRLWWIFTRLHRFTWAFCHSTILSCWPEMRFRWHIWLQWMTWRVCTFAQAQLSLRHCTKILCVGSTDDLCPIYTNSEGSGESAPVNTTTGCNHRCVISMLNSRLWKSSIKLIDFIKKMSFHATYAFINIGR